MSMSRQRGWNTVHQSRASHVNIDRDHHRRYSNSNSTPSHRHHHHSGSMDDGSPIPSTAPAREECWTEEATFTLIEAWGDHYVGGNLNLRQKHWQEVANAVNSLHRHTCRSDIQCKNRMDTLKKRYKTEKSKINKASSKPYYRYTSSSWPFFSRLDSLIATLPEPVLEPATAPTPLPRHKPQPAFLSSVFSFPVGRRSKRPAPVISPPPGFNSHCRRNFPNVASHRRLGDDEEVEVDNAYRQLGEAILRFGEIYERVEDEKCRNMMELEKHRMQFVKDLELQRLLFMESQLLLQKLKPSSKTYDHKGIIPGEQSN